MPTLSPNACFVVVVLVGWFLFCFHFGNSEAIHEYKGTSDLMLLQLMQKKLSVGHAFCPSADKILTPYAYLLKWK